MKDSATILLSTGPSSIIWIFSDGRVYPERNSFDFSLSRFWAATPAWADPVSLESASPISPKIVLAIKMKRRAPTAVAIAFVPRKGRELL